MKNKNTIGLHIFRILLCSLILMNIFNFLNQSDILFSNDGIFEYERYKIIAKNYNFELISNILEWLSIDVYLYITAIVAIVYATGIGGYISGIILYILLLNLSFRNLYILDGSDSIIRVTLFFLIFADTYRYGLFKNLSFTIKSLSNLFTGLFKVQIVIVYFYTGIVKLFLGEDWRDGSALHYILQLNDFQGTSYNTFLSNNYYFVKVTTYSTIIFELLFPLILFNSRMRYVIIFFGILFHIGIFIFMRIPVFPFIMIATYFTFVSDETYVSIYDRLKQYVISTRVNLIKKIAIIFVITFSLPCLSQDSLLIKTNHFLKTEFKNKKLNNLTIAIKLNGLDTVIHYGDSIKNENLYEIGSISKVITGLAFYDIARNYKIAVDERINLSSSLHRLTYRNLYTHTSGIIDNPTNISKGNDPTKSYTIDKFHYFINKYKLIDSCIGKFSYSNTGVMLLSLCMENITKKSINYIIDNKINEIGLPNTTIVNYRLLNNLHKGYNENNVLQSNWDFNYFVSAGGIHSNGNDMLKLISYFLGLHKKSDYLDFFKSQYLDDNIEISTFLFIDRNYKNIVYWHNGGTNGFSSHISFSTKNDNGYCILTNKDVDLDNLVAKLNMIFYYK